jgi:hypothetical protein
VATNPSKSEAPSVGEELGETEARTVVLREANLSVYFLGKGR